MTLGDPVTLPLPAPTGGVQLETFVPWTLVKRGSTKQIVTSLNASLKFIEEARRGKRARAATQDTPLIRALRLAHYWQRLLDEQRGASVNNLVEAEGIDVTQARRLMNLT
ncbi:bacteriophage-like protein [Ralstonia solanacearum]|nr:bacteriophage-like protein [Ralstonia solanacearum]NJZ80638.1 bacteriophage-like protein [Ralstonia solanacearum]NKA90985.1 bacteriophage-like protein [Ralstonia solanacearum]NKF82367.1 bacteriophage-like protein [Ralstonia solanacearum]